MSRASKKKTGNNKPRVAVDTRIHLGDTADRKQNAGSSKNKNRTSIQSSNFTSRYFIEGNENESTKISVSPCLLEHHLPQLRHGRLDKGVTRMDTIQPSKRRPCHF